MSIDSKLEELKESLVSDVKSIIEGTFTESKDDGDGKIESKEELLSYANKLASKAFGDDVDSEKVKGIVDNAIKDSDGDWEKASGIVTGSFNEDCDKTEDGKEVLTETECEDCGKVECECEKEEVTEEEEKEESESEVESEEKEDEDK